jgi:DNA-binding protein HU-alpha
MTKAEFVEHVAIIVQLPKHQIDAVLTRCLQGIMDVVRKGNTIELRGFGRFRLRHRPARTGHNPRTGDILQMPAKAVPAFTVGKAFQTLV